MADSATWEQDRQIEQMINSLEPPELRLVLNIFEQRYQRERTRRDEATKIMKRFIGAGTILMPLITALTLYSLQSIFG